MQSPERNKSNNIVHYEQVYKGFAGKLIAKADTPIRRDVLFEKSKRHTLSTRAFYHDDFQKELSDKTVLDIGAGKGLNSVLMAHFGAEVNAQDIAPASAVLINELASKLNLPIQAEHGDLVAMPYKAHSFDLVVGKSILHHLTHEVERAYLSRMRELVREDGALRFVEPAHNMPFLRKCLLLIPQKGRPSILNSKAYAAYKLSDPHPERSNSASHYKASFQAFFDKVDVLPYGIEQTLLGCLPPFLRNKLTRKFVHVLAGSLPRFIHYKLAKVQLIIAKRPKSS